MAKYYVISCHVLWREISHFASMSGNVVNFEFLDQGLHDTPEVLRKKLQAAIDDVEGDYDAILIGYGLCCRGIEGIVAGKHRLVLVKAHDCITHLLGSRERYKEFFDAHPGTYWYSPGWIDSSLMPGKERYERLFETYVEKYGKDNAEYLMEMEQGWFKKYSTVAYVDLGFGDTAKYKEYSRDCAAWLDWEYKELAGDSRLIVDLLEGRWNQEDFLIVEPGENIVTLYNDDIIGKTNGSTK